ncbi:MAG: hypothetical protein QME32_00245 [Endomicrobiia bacterium]|nr:hypothetical protein [Endomicrobiia bacterium]
MAQQINLLTCSFDSLRLVTPFWSVNTILEALRIIRATWKKYGDTMQESEVICFLRKESIIRSELRHKMRRKGIDKSQTHRLEEKLIGHNVFEGALKIR